MTTTQIKEQINSRLKAIKEKGGTHPVSAGPDDGPVSLKLFLELVNVVETQQRQIEQLKQNTPTHVIR